MSFKLNQEKAINMLQCITPWRMIVNAAAYVDTSEFVSPFKAEGFSVISVDKIGKSEAQRKRLWEGNCSLIVYGNEISEQDLRKFEGVYTYVYLYPNSSKSYGQHIKRALQTGSIKAEDKADMDAVGVPAFVKKCMDKNRELYKEHCELCEDRVLTVLV